MFFPVDGTVHTSNIEREKVCTHMLIDTDWQDGFDNNLLSECAADQKVVTGEQIVVSRRNL